MTIFVGVISQKGGVGKSTISRLLAREYAIAKWDVKIADLDISQGTSNDWKKRREINEIQPYVAVESFRTVSQALKHAQVHDLMIFDGAPHSTKASNEIAQKSDLVILPTGLSLDDLRPTVLLAHELIEAKIPDDNIVFALCRVGDRANEIEEARSYIKKAGYTTLAGSLPEKTAYRRASDEGKAISEVSYLSLRKRADEVVQDIINRITEKS